MTPIHSRKFLTRFRLFAAALLLSAQAHAADPPDTLTLTDGEKLSGKLVRATGAAVTFHSDSAGDVTIPWAKIKELTSSRRFAVIPKGIIFKRQESDAKIPRGVLAFTDGKIQVTPSGGQPVQTFATGDTGFIIDEDSYQKALHTPGFNEDWKGSVTGGVSLMEATQTSETFTGAAHFSRAIPTEDWLAARSRTLVNFTASYGKIDQPATPEVKTDLIHFDGEQDEYFSPRLYVLGQAAFDHNFSQGLSLQQTYSVGAGREVLKSDKQTLDLKATMSYISQRFNGEANKSLIGSVFNETYHRNLPAGIKFDEHITLVPAWNNTNAYSANAGAAVTIALYKRMSLNISALDTFLNDPPPSFKKNSFQFTMGVTYSLP
jgi:putative salt-induced outer membrane protein YdiY